MRFILLSILFLTHGVYAMTGLNNKRLSPCPNALNCASSDESSKTHYIEPYKLSAPASDVWQALVAVLRSQKDLTIVEQSESYILAEVRSRVFRFIDDVEFHLREEDGYIAIRSASRLGYSDFSVNRKRLEGIRDLLAEQQLVLEGD